MAESYLGKYGRLFRIWVTLIGEQLPMREHLRFYRHRWFKVWIAMIALSTALIAVIETVGNQAVLPAAFFYGAAAGPIALLVAIHDRTGIGNSVPGMTLIGMFLFGGGVALMIGGYFDSLLITSKNGPTILRVGWIEEAAKIVPPLAVALKGRYLTKAAGRRARPVVRDRLRGHGVDVLRLEEHPLRRCDRRGHGAVPTRSQHSSSATSSGPA